MEGRELDDLGEIAHVAFSAQILLMRSKAPFLRCSAALVSESLRMSLGHHVGVEGPVLKADVDHAGLHRLADLEGRDRLRPPMKLICRTPLPSLLTSAIQSSVRFT